MRARFMLSTPALTVAAALACGSALVCQAHAQAAEIARAKVVESATSSATSSILSTLKGATAQNAPEAAAAGALSPVREAALRDTARTLGAQAGLGDASRRIVAIIESMSSELDATYRFSELMMGVGILPASISKVDNASAVEGGVMRVATVLYRLDEPARPVIIPPTWRDWLYVGLNPSLKPSPPSNGQLLPRDEAEKRYWNQRLDEAYAVGVGQANAIYESNLARLKRTFKGMRTFYDLYEQGLVTAPQVIATSSIINREDPNTVVIGETVFKIVRPTDFVEDTKQWRPLGK